MGLVFVGAVAARAGLGVLGGLVLVVGPVRLLVVVGGLVVLFAFGVLGGGALLGCVG
jgi:hypothetical protein